jgi:sulfatase maturation enzyme AslB (radical SAM superfamily)
MKLYSESYDSRRLIAWVDLSTYCNAGCPQCHRTSPNGDKVDWLPLIQWDLQTFKKAFSPKELNHYTEIELCGTFGDPIMNKDIFEIVSYIIEHGRPSVKINTNGSLRDEEWWWNLGCLSKDKLNVWFAVDGCTQEMHELYRQKTDLQKIKENVEAYCATGATAHVMTIVFKHNQNYKSEIEQMVRGWGVTGEMLFVNSTRFNPHDPYVKGIVLEKADDC